MLDLDLAVGLGRDDRRGAALDQPEAQGIAVITLVRDQVLRGRHGIDRQHGDLGIVRIAWRQEQDVGTAFLVADGVELGVAAAFGRADTMSQGPPFAPPAVR